MFLGVIFITVAGQYWIVQYGGDFTSTVPLNEDEWIITAVLGAFSIPVGLLMRLIPVSEDPRSFALQGQVGATREGGGGKGGRGASQGFANKLVQLAAIVVPVAVLYSVLQLLQEGREVDVEGIVGEWGLFVDRFRSHWGKVDNPDLDGGGAGGEL
jgi:hypothetical protein